MMFIVGHKRGQGVRLSFHFYNTESEIRFIVKILKQVDSYS